MSRKRMMNNVQKLPFLWLSPSLEFLLETDGDFDFFDDSLSPTIVGESA